MHFKPLNSIPDRVCLPEAQIPRILLQQLSEQRSETQLISIHEQTSFHQSRHEA